MKRLIKNYIKFINKINIYTIIGTLNISRRLCPKVKPNPKSLATRLEKCRPRFSHMKENCEKLA